MKQKIFTCLLCLGLLSILFRPNIFAENLQENLNNCKEDMYHAHLLAESARKLGYSEDDKTILKAKEIWKIKNFEKLDIEKQLQELKKSYVGEFKLTGYCPCYSCSEGWGNNTASGIRAVEGVTIAADINKLPLGTRVYIDGVGERIVQDVGGAIKGNKIDVYVNNHGDCFKANYNDIVSVYILN